MCKIVLVEEHILGEMLRQCVNPSHGPHELHILHSWSYTCVELYIIRGTNGEREELLHTSVPLVHPT